LPGGTAQAVFACKEPARILILKSCQRRAEGSGGPAAVRAEMVRANQIKLKPQANAKNANKRIFAIFAFFCGYTIGGIALATF
jgi:hypothetical protein